MNKSRVYLRFHLPAATTIDVSVPIEKYAEALDYLSTWEVASNQMEFFCSVDELAVEFIKRFVL